jgi:glutamyl-tRNA synthetase
MMKIPHTTRFAPSPTGLLHIGNARTALFNWLIARATGGIFVLRIDDTDAARNTPEAVQVIDDAMEWLRLDHDVRVRQSDRLGLYEAVADMMLMAGVARRDGAAVRFVPGNMPAGWVDTIAGSVAISRNDSDVIEGLVLIRSDGMPTYHFASVVDDMDMGVTWVIRGTDHFSNTAKHVALWSALSMLDWSGNGRPLPLFSHVGLLTQGGRKVSKRDGSASLLAYRDNGIGADAMCNWLLRLGWGPTVDDKTTKMIPRERALELFLDGGHMRSSSANLDPMLLASLDRKYKGARERASRIAVMDAAAPRA